MESPTWTPFSLHLKLWLCVPGTLTPLLEIFGTYSLSSVLKNIQSSTKLCLLPTLALSTIGLPSWTIWHLLLFAMLPTTEKSFIANKSFRKTWTRPSSKCFLRRSKNHTKLMCRTSGWALKITCSLTLLTPLWPNMVKLLLKRLTITRSK